LDFNGKSGPVIGNNFSKFKKLYDEFLNSDDLVNFDVKLKYFISLYDIKQDMELNPDLKYYSEDKIKNNFKEISTELRNILIELKQKQLEGYKKKPLIRYLYGRQFNLLYSISDPNKRNQIEPLLKYITNDCYHKRVDNFKVKNDGDLIHNNIQDWENYLNQILKHNKLTLDIIYKPTLIIQKKFEH